MRKLFIMLLGAAALVFPSSALAVLCVSKSGYVCCFDEPSTGYTYTNASSWQTYNPGRSYYARRRRDDNSISYNHYASQGEYHFFDNGSNAFRRTALYRDGTAGTDYSMNQWAIGSCF